jgi:hypothetical protein
MKTKPIATCFGVLSACLAISSPAVAEDNCSGYSIEVGNAIVLIQDDRTLPFHLARGVCATTGASSSTCTSKDDDGDEATNVSEWTGAGVAGTWRTVSGTGKYAKATSSHGWWKYLRTIYSPSGEAVTITATGGYCALADKKNR